MRLARAIILLCALSAAGCGSSGERRGSPTAEEPTTGATATEPATSVVNTQPAPAPTETGPAGTLVRIYLLREGKLAVTSRLLPTTATPARAALDQLFQSMAPYERNAGLTTAVRPNTIERLVIRDGVATLDAARRLRPDAELAQVVYTLTQFPTVRRVSVVLETNDATELTRSDFEEFTPAILVESPTPGDQVSSPIRVRGSANTFEATLQLELVDQRRKVVGKRFVTATSGNGTRGTFDATLPYAGARPGLAELVAFEIDADSGGRKNVVRIPVVLSP